jgi:hypothetical protein
MKLCAIFHCWSDWYLLDHAVSHIETLVDGIIVIGSVKSNYGEISDIPEQWLNDPRLIVRDPVHNHAMHAETDKRNYGLRVAKDQGYTHFITCDSDELYDPEEFLKAKQYIVDRDLAGLVVESQGYFKSPTLTIGKDVTLVPHIHKLTPTIKHEFNKQYPFSWINGQIRIDPTRSFNINSGVEMVDCTMHHMSWIRTDYEKKIRNSTARANLTKSTIVHDLVNAKEGEMCHFYGKRLLRVANRFNIPEYGEEGIRTLAENIQLQQSLAAADKAPQPKRG